ncbi:hypothetical protein DFR76_105155 [Nocardia pseudobrasiliensis]|uniref:Uncharacterized protein n=2 Tax=Nocardia pseudobrasiliensis TaxID=45979 RepID=A0A370I543_9NOCA|nr:hypothetical protein DFR76_105155 [Nocardia pseudobrasiliensis]
MKGRRLAISPNPLVSDMAMRLRRALDDEYAPLPDLGRLPPLMMVRDKAPAAQRENAQARYDAYFGVRRTRDRNALAHGILIGSHGILDNLRSTRSNLSSTQWRALTSGIHSTLSLLFPAEGYAPCRYSPLPHSRSAPDPDRRWRLGHRAFFVLTQCVIIGLRGFLDAAERAAWHDAVTALDYGTTMLASSEACLRFTADFPPHDYRRTVRPAMPTEFTGLASADHACLVALLRAVGPLLHAMPAEFVAHGEALSATLHSVYLAHQGICARFDGDHNPSLRMAQHSALPATTALVRLARSRCRLLEP